jgi:hypothetical protein
MAEVARWETLHDEFKEQLGEETTLAEYQALEINEVDEFIKTLPLAKKGPFRLLYKLGKPAPGSLPLSKNPTTLSSNLLSLSPSPDCTLTVPLTVQYPDCTLTIFI